MICGLLQSLSASGYYTPFTISAPYFRFVFVCRVILLFLCIRVFIYSCAGSVTGLVLLSLHVNILNTIELYYRYIQEQMSLLTIFTVTVILGAICSYYISVCILVCGLLLDWIFFKFIPLSLYLVWWLYCQNINHLKTKRRPLYLKNQFVPRSKHFSSRL